MPTYMMSAEKGGSRNAANLRTNSIYLADKDRGSKNSKTVWTSYMEAPTELNARGLVASLLASHLESRRARIKVLVSSE